MLLPRGGVRGDRFSYGAPRSNPGEPPKEIAVALAVKGTLILRTAPPFAGWCSREGLWLVLLRLEGSPNLTPNLPATKGARESLRRGIRATIQGARVLHSVF